MNGYTYTAAELLRTARWAVKGKGRYLRWELRLGTAHISMVVYYRDRDGAEKVTTVAI